MSTLVVVGYDDRFKAEEVRLKLLKLQKEYLIDMEDAVVAVKDEKGKVKLHQAVNLTTAGAASGGFWGSLLGLIFLNPLLGMAVGAAAGAVSGALTDVGINDRFMKELADALAPGNSALFVLVRKSTRFGRFSTTIFRCFEDTGLRVRQSPARVLGTIVGSTWNPLEVAYLFDLPRLQAVLGDLTQGPRNRKIPARHPGQRTQAADTARRDTDERPSKTIRETLDAE